MVEIKGFLSDSRAFLKECASSYGRGTHRHGGSMLVHRDLHVPGDLASTSHGEEALHRVPYINGFKKP